MSSLSALHSNEGLLCLYYRMSDHAASKSITSSDRYLRARTNNSHSRDSILPASASTHRLRSSVTVPRRSPFEWTVHEGAKQRAYLKQRGRTFTLKGSIMFRPVAHFYDDFSETVLLSKPLC